MSRAAAFTLLEILVVIATIAILIAILVPSLGTARRRARQVVCASNLRQWGVATRLYADINDGFLPRRGQGVQPTQQIDRAADWFNALPPLLNLATYSELAARHQIPRPNDRSLWSCPDAVDNNETPFFSYGMNMWLSVYNTGANDRADKFYVVGEPASMVLLADGPAAFASISPATPNFPYSPVARHAGRVNIAYLDGHVDSPTAAYVGANISFVEHADLRWRVPDSKWASAQH